MGLAPCWGASGQGPPTPQEPYLLCLLDWTRVKATLVVQFEQCVQSTLTPAAVPSPLLTPVAVALCCHTFHMTRCSSSQQQVQHTCVCMHVCCSCQPVQAAPSSSAAAWVATPPETSVSSRWLAAPARQPSRDVQLDQLTMLQCLAVFDLDPEDQPWTRNDMPVPRGVSSVPCV